MPVPDAVLRLLATDDLVKLTSDHPSAPDAETTALLAWISSVTGARTMVEIGSADGVTAGALVAGQRDRGIVTSVESDRTAHDAAQARLAGPITDGRVRLMQGVIADVLDRLTDDGYGLALVQHDPSDYENVLEDLLRLLVPGGVLIARRVLDPEHADDLAPFLQRVAEEASTCTILDLDGGLLLATI